MAMAGSCRTVSLDATVTQRAISDANGSLGGYKSLNEHQLASVQMCRDCKSRSWQLGTRRCLLQRVGAMGTALSVRSPSASGTTTQPKQTSAMQAIAGAWLELASLWREGGYTGP